MSRRQSTQIIWAFQKDGTATLAFGPEFEAVL
jgi:hypothetical protein